MALRKIGTKSSTRNSQKKLTPSNNAVSSYYISLCETAHKKAISYLQGELEKQGVKCKLTSNANAKYLIVSAGLDVLTKQAEKDEWMMNVSNSKEMMAFHVEKMDKFERSSRWTVFESAVEVQLLHRTIEDTSYDIDTFRKLSYEVEGGKGFLSALVNSKPPLVDEHFPLHDHKQVGDLNRMLKESMMPLKGVDVDAVRNYFGESTAFYFAWMDFYSTCVLVPGVMGVVMYFLRGRQTTVDTDPYLPFYSVFMAIWALLFLIFWQRRSAVHSFNWNTHSYCSHDELHYKFHGVIVTDPITGGDMLYYPFWKKRLWYLFSFLAMLPLLLGGVVVMTLSLNLNGYVQDKGSPIYIERLAQFARPGRIFAADSPYCLWLVPTLMHTIVINIVNMIYSQVARKCTDLENHRTVHQWHSALVLKRVFFECFDCFMPLFYIAFYQLDVVVLRAEIVSLFMSDEIRRVIMEAVIPLVTSLCKKKRARSQLRHGRDGHEEYFLSVYDQFDDYLEMVIQFGYITLFASAFPLGAVVTMLFIYIELRSDVFKLLHAYRRPLPLKCSNIGIWYEVMRVMVFTAIFTNCAILGFSSEQLMQWLPFLFTEEEDAGGSHVMAMGSGRYVVGIVFGFEHALLVLALLLQYAIHPVPKWVRNSIAHRDYLMRKRNMSSAASAHEHTPHLLQHPDKKEKTN